MRNQIPVPASWPRLASESANNTCATSCEGVMVSAICRLHSAPVLAPNFSIFTRIRVVSESLKQQKVFQSSSSAEQACQGAKAMEQNRVSDRSRVLQLWHPRQLPRMPPAGNQAMPVPVRASKEIPPGAGLAAIGLQPSAQEGLQGAESGAVSLPILLATQRLGSSVPKACKNQRRSCCPK